MVLLWVWFRWLWVCVRGGTGHKCEFAGGEHGGTGPECNFAVSVVSLAVHVILLAMSVDSPAMNVILLVMSVVLLVECDFAGCEHGFAVNCEIGE